jgi:hypothetical protein
MFLAAFRVSSSEFKFRVQASACDAEKDKLKLEL